MPKYVVPIKNVGGTLEECMEFGKSSEIQRLKPIKALADGWSCSSDASRAIGRQIQCIIDDISPAEALLRQAQDLGNASVSEKNEEKCSLAGTKAERAARLGSGEAAYIVFHAMMRGSYRGICESEVGVGRAVVYLKEAASAGIAAAEVDLAISLIDTVDGGVLEKIREPEFSLYKMISRSLQAEESIAMQQAMGLLNSAARKNDAHAMAVLVRIYGLGVLEQGDLQLALAWATVRNPEDDGTDRSTDFGRLYRLSNKETRNGACSKIRQITGSNINFRFAPGEIKNRFFMNCGGTEATVTSRSCLDSEALKRIDEFLQPVLLQHLACRGI